LQYHPKNTILIAVADTEVAVAVADTEVAVAVLLLLFERKHYPIV
jgi:hypothetical protein